MERVSANHTMTLRQQAVAVGAKLQRAAARRNASQVRATYSTLTPSMTAEGCVVRASGMLHPELPNPHCSQSQLDDQLVRAPAERWPT